MRSGKFSFILGMMLSILLLGSPIRKAFAAGQQFGVFLNGTNVTTAPSVTVYTGQQLNFSVSYPIHAIKNTQTKTVTIQWSIDGHPISNYVIGNDRAHVVEFPASNLTLPAFTCYLLAYGPATATVNVTEAITPGTTYNYSGGVFLNILKPAITPVPTTGHFIYTNTGTIATLRMGDLSGNPGGDGMHISNTGSDPVSLPASTYCWCQLLHSFDTTINHILFSHNAVDPTLDGGYPYNASNITNYEDCPGQGAPTIGGLNPEITVSINATVYLMWNCGISGAIPVPINTIDWNASGVEVNGNITGTEPTVSGTQTDVLLPPTWNNTRT